MKNDSDFKNKKAFFKQHRSKSLKYLGIFQLIIVMALFGAVGLKYLASSSAINYAVASGYVKDQHGKGVGGVKIIDCQYHPELSNAVTTNSSGKFAITYPQGTQHCIRIISLPRYYGNKVGLHVQPEAPYKGSYEWQIAGEDCYHNTVYCGPNGLKYKTDIAVTQQDLSYDNLFDFRVTYSPPQPKPKPAPSPQPSGGGSSSSGSSSSGGGSYIPPLQPTTTPNPAPKDTKAPTKPASLAAIKDSESKTVLLTWEASNDNIGVKGYKIQRSTDKKKWDTLEKSFNDISYQDFTVDFGQHYYYRVAAVDGAGNTSKYATTDIETDDFSSNLSADGDTRVSSKDGVVTMIISNGSLGEEAFCAVQDSTDLGPNILHYQLLRGPYELICRDKDGNILSSFNNPLKLEVALDKTGVKNPKTLAYYGKNTGDWTKLTVDLHNEGEHKDEVNLKDSTIVAVMAQQKQASAWGAIIIILLIILALGGGTILFLWLRQRNALQAKYEDYVRKSHGY